MDRLGIALKYPLTGLVRCAHCGRSMIPSGSGPYHGKDGRENRYVAYACPGYHSGACHNNRRIPEPWLRAEIMRLIREALFFGPDKSAQ